MDSKLHERRYRAAAFLLVVLLTTSRLSLAWVFHQHRSKRPNRNQSSSGTSVDCQIQPQPTDRKDSTVQTRNWCEKFVVPLNLCPWAAASVRNNAIEILVTDQPSDFAAMIEQAADAFHQQLDRVDPNTAITLCVLDNNNGSFEEFYDWYLDLEDSWLDQADGNEQHTANFVTLAPFHPEWEYVDKNVVQFEKRSPYPTVSIVSTAVIDKAGPSVTQQIGDTNAITFGQRSSDEWVLFYERAVREGQAGCQSTLS